MGLFSKKYEIKKLEEEKLELQDALEASENARKALREEVERLSNIISSNTTDCKIGPWCKTCKHIEYDSAKYKTYDRYGNDRYGNDRYSRFMHDGKISYCMKHMHDLCPEFERNGEFRC